MRIEVLPCEDGTVRFDSLAVGDCFRLNRGQSGVFLVKAHGLGVGTPDFGVKIDNGCVVKLVSDDRVLPVKAKVVIR